MNQLNPDFRDMLTALLDAEAEFLLVGAYALSAHGQDRMTGDIDLWVRPTAENAARVWRALQAYRAPMRDLTVEDLATPDVVYQIGIPPHRIDVLTSIDGVEFEEAWSSRVAKGLAGLKVDVLAPHLLLRNKLKTGRHKDLIDADWLQRKIHKGELPGG
ncbi:MAG: hypothetical protein H0T51_00450 [Pirellulales bacterium]|nr:hypothetical protein [Pirellulales bacterium]